MNCTFHRKNDIRSVVFFKFKYLNSLDVFQHCLAMFEELEELQSHMFEHDDEVELTAKNGRATMVQKNRIKAEVLKPVSVDETMESEEFEVEEEQEEFDDSVEGENYTVLSTEIVEVSAMLEQN